MDSLLPYIACVLVALAMYVALRPSRKSVRIGGIATGTAAAGWLLGISVASLVPLGGDTGGPFFYIFALAAVASAIRMISHDRPVYAALYFVLVVLATAGLLLLLGAEFVAFALIIVYAGAILITYMFVLMLATQATDSEHPQTQAASDRIPREPAAAVAVGFLLLALVTGTMLRGSGEFPEADRYPESGWRQLEDLPRQFQHVVLDADPSFAWPPKVGEDGDAIRLDTDGAFVRSQDGSVLRLDDQFLPRNTQRVGWSLVHDFPINLELAGVILLMAMFGAIVLARRAIDMGEEDKDAAIAAEDAAS